MGFEETKFKYKCDTDGYFRREWMEKSFRFALSFVRAYLCDVETHPHGRLFERSTSSLHRFPVRGNNRFKRIGVRRQSEGHHNPPCVSLPTRCLKSCHLHCMHQLFVSHLELNITLRSNLIHQHLIRDFLIFLFFIIIRAFIQLNLV
jgi:hypothetical protein